MTTITFRRLAMRTSLLAGLLHIPLLTGCAAEPDDPISSSSANSSSATISDTSSLAGEWLLTKIIENESSELIYEQLVANFNAQGKLALQTPCLDVDFQWSDVNQNFQQGTQPIQTCNPSELNNRVIALIEDAKIPSNIQAGTLTLTGNGYSLIFESFQPPCSSPIVWSPDVTFTQFVQLNFDSVTSANKALKEFILVHEDFEILSWEQGCHIKDQERVNARANLKTINILRCTSQVNAIDFLQTSEGPL